MVGGGIKIWGDLPHPPSRENSAKDSMTAVKGFLRFLFKYLKTQAYSFDVSKILDGIWIKLLIHFIDILRLFRAIPHQSRQQLLVEIQQQRQLLIRI